MHQSPVFVPEVPPERPSRGFLLSQFRAGFKRQFSWTNGAIIPVAGAVLALVIDPGDQGWVGAVLTVALSVGWAGTRAASAPIATWRRWHRALRLFNSPEAKQTRLALEIADRAAYIKGIHHLLEAIDREEVSARAFVSIPQYAEYRTSERAHSYLFSYGHSMGWDINPPAVDEAAPLADEPALETFLVRGEGNATAWQPYSQEHRDAERRRKRQLFRQELHYFQRIREKARTELTRETALMEQLHRKVTPCLP